MHNLDPKRLIMMMHMKKAKKNYDFCEEFISDVDIFFSDELVFQRNH